MGPHDGVRPFSRESGIGIAISSPELWTFAAVQMLMVSIVDGFVERNSATHSSSGQVISAETLCSIPST